MNDTKLLRRRGGDSHGRDARADRKAGASDEGARLVEHFLTASPRDAKFLLQDLDPSRRHVKMLDLTPAKLEARLARHTRCIPDDLLLYVRFSSKYDCPLDVTAQERLKPRVLFGPPERDVGPFPLIQIATVAAPMNRVRTGRATVLVRAALSAVQATQSLVSGGAQ
jgi:hypothetical protein